MERVKNHNYQTLVFQMQSWVHLFILKNGLITSNNVCPVMEKSVPSQQWPSDGMNLFRLKQ